jgi:hypothetical protein
MDQSDKAVNCQELKAVVLQLGFDLFVVADFIQKQGFVSLAIAASQIIDWDKRTRSLSFPFSRASVDYG